MVSDVDGRQEPVKLTDVLYVPGLAVNLISTVRMMQEGMSSISKGGVEYWMKDVDGQQKKVIKGQLSGYPTLLRLVEVVAYAETGLSASVGDGASAEVLL